MYCFKRKQFCSLQYSESSQGETLLALYKLCGIFENKVNSIVPPVPIDHAAK